MSCLGKKCGCLVNDSVLPDNCLASCLTSIWPPYKIERKLKWLNDRVLHKHKRKLTCNLPNSPRPFLSFLMTLEIRSESQTDTLGTVLAIGSSTSNESRYNSYMRQNQSQNGKNQERNNKSRKMKNYGKKDKEQDRLTTKCMTQQQTVFLSHAPANANFNWSTTNWHTLVSVIASTCITAE